MAAPDFSLIADHLTELWDRDATDLLLTVGSPPLLRIDGVLVQIDSPTIDQENAETIVATLLGTELLERFHAEKEVDFSFRWNERGRFRVNAFHQRGMPAVSLRLIPYRIPTFEDLRIPKIVEDLIHLPQGLVLVTGPTGTGKSTSLAAMIDTINRERACHIITIEDPIEYVYEHKMAAVNQRELGQDTLSFSRALRSVLREDPDVLLVGEMRDVDTIAATLTIAETGHLVFATVHTNDAAQTLDRIVDVFPAEQQAQIRVQLAGSLQAIISQRLLPMIGGGRVAAFEILIADLRGEEHRPRRPDRSAPQPARDERARRHAHPRDVADRAGRGRAGELRGGHHPLAVPRRGADRRPGVDAGGGAPLHRDPPACIVARRPRAGAVTRAFRVTSTPACW